MDLPPRIVIEQDITPFVDGLEFIIPDKLIELFDLQEKLLKEKREWYGAILQLRREKKLDSFAVYFWTLWAELNFSDFYTSQKWIQYWLLLLNKIPDKKIEMPKEYQSRFERESIIQCIKTTPIENFYQGQLRGGGVRLTGLCPFHDEKTPSFHIYITSNTYNCFGCGKNGDVIEFLMATRKISFNEVLALLK